MRLLIFFLFQTCLLTIHNVLQAQNLIFEANFDNTTETTNGESPLEVIGNSFSSGIANEAILIQNGDILKYDLTDNILASAGSMTVWVKPNWAPGTFLYRILSVESDPVFELHVDEGASLVLAMFSDQIETRVASAFVGDWLPNEWHLLGFNWSSDKIEIYVDGFKVAETEVGFTIPDFVSGIINIGSTNGSVAFEGLMDELRIFDSPLTSTEHQDQYDNTVGGFEEANAIKLIDIFDRDITDTGIVLVDWEGPVRNPAMKYYLQGNDELIYPVQLTMTTGVENTSFSLPSTISSSGPSKAITLTSADDLASFLFSYYMDQDFDNESFDLTISYSFEGLPSQQVIPVTVLDQDRDRPLSYPVVVDFSEAVHPVITDPDAQKVITQAAEDWLYYVDGSGIDEIAAGQSVFIAGGQDHFFDEKELSNPVPYTGYYLFAFGNSNEGPCVCSTGFPNREMLQTSNGIEVPIFRIGGLHLNVFGQAFETEPTGWEVDSPYDNWTNEGYVGTDMYSLAKHEIGHAMVFENSPLFLQAQGRDPGNPFPDETITPTPNGFTSPAITAYYPDGVVPLFANSLSHVIDVLDPASQVPPYGGGVPVEVMPGGREMLTKLDILIMESVGYPLRENEVTRTLSIDAENDFVGDEDVAFSVQLTAQGGIPFYHFSIIEGELPDGINLDPLTGIVMGVPQEVGQFPVTFMVKDYDENSVGATLNAVVSIGEILSDKADLLSYQFEDANAIEESTIDSLNNTIHFRFKRNTDISDLSAIIEISEGASISPIADEPQDFTSPVSYTITSEDGQVTTTWTIVVEVVLSTDTFDHRVTIYPNPSRHNFHVEMKNVSNVDLSLIGINGQSFWSSSVRSNSIVTVPTVGLPQGVYFLRVYSDELGNRVFKVLLQE